MKIVLTNHGRNVIIISTNKQHNILNNGTYGKRNFLKRYSKRNFRKTNLRFSSTKRFYIYF